MQEVFCIHTSIAEISMICYMADNMILTVLLLVECDHSRRTSFRILSRIWKKDTWNPSLRWYSKVGSFVFISANVRESHISVIVNASVTFLNCGTDFTQYAECIVIPASDISLKQSLPWVSVLNDCQLNDDTVTYTLLSWFSFTYHMSLTPASENVSSPKCDTASIWSLTAPSDWYYCVVYKLACLLNYLLPTLELSSSSSSSSSLI